MSKKILLISDTHSYLDSKIINLIPKCDELWHAGDIGNVITEDYLPENVVFRAVYGNIDDNNNQLKYPEILLFDAEGITVLIKHIGGTPGRYKKDVKMLLLAHKPAIFICGHSHILVIKKDEEFGHWHINPGAAGHEGFHTLRTALWLELDNKKISKIDVLQLGKRGIKN